jgi:hypothetical protein
MVQLIEHSTGNAASDCTSDVTVRLSYCHGPQYSSNGTAVWKHAQYMLDQQFTPPTRSIPAGGVLQAGVAAADCLHHAPDRHGGPGPSAPLCKHGGVSPCTLRPLLLCMVPTAGHFQLGTTASTPGPHLAGPCYS